MGINNTARHLNQYETSLVAKYATSLKKVAKNVKRYRKERGLSQLEMATLLGLTESFVSKLEQGRTAPSFPTLDKLAKILKISTSQLFE